MSKQRTHFRITRWLLKTPLKFLVNQLCADIKRICPYDDNYIYELADRIILRETFMAGMVMLLFLLLNAAVGMVNFFTFAYAILIAHVIITEWSGAQLYKLRKRIDKEFSLFLSSMKNAYNTSHSVVFALRSASESFSIEIQRYAAIIEMMLTKKNAADIVRTYISDYRNSAYIRLFISCCYQCSTIGDSIDKNGVSVFSKNMQIIKEELENHIIHDDKARFKFMGFTLVTVIPGAFLNILQVLAMNFMEGTAIYYSQYGLFIQIAIFGLTWYVYNTINNIKNRRDAKNFTNNRLFEKIKDITGFAPKKSTEKKLHEKLALTGRDLTPAAFCNQMLLLGVVAFIAMIVLSIAFHVNSRNRVLESKTVDIPGLSAESAPEITDMVVYYAKRYKNSFNETSKMIISDNIEQSLKAGDSHLKDRIVSEIESRIADYKKISLFTWTQYLFCILVATAIGFAPYISLEFQWRVYMSRKNEEIRLFQIVILLMKDVSTTTILSILSAMENQSFLYRTLLMQITNEYSHDADRALRMLRSECSNKSEADALFTELVNSICNVPRVGMDAFINIENDIDFAKRYDMLTEEKEFESSSVIIEMISYIPSILTIGLYFIVPFVIVSLQELQGSLEVIKELLH